MTITPSGLNVAAVKVENARLRDLGFIRALALSPLWHHPPTGLRVQRLPQKWLLELGFKELAVCRTFDSLCAAICAHLLTGKM